MRLGELIESSTVNESGGESEEGVENTPPCRSAAGVRTAEEQGGSQQDDEELGPVGDGYPSAPQGQYFSVNHLIHHGGSNKLKRRLGDISPHTWGTRLINDDKRQQSMEESLDRVLGNRKRKWGDTSARVWGKRGYYPLKDGQKWGSTVGQEKRKWGTQTARAWGKRSEGDGFGQLWGSGLAKTTLREDYLDSNKRKWGEQSVRIWGKREDNEEEKRKWGETSARIWGKRERLDEDKMK